MNQQEYQDLFIKEGASHLARPFWSAEESNKKIWDDLSLTVLICQRKTKEVTQLCLESLMGFYPDVKILVADGDSQDSSSLYLRYMELKHSNIKVWTRVGNNSHGDTMHEAITDYIDTEYVLLMDSDVITMRHGMIEGMLHQFDQNKKMYATGNLMLVSKSNQACGEPADKNDVLRYAHPCLSVYHVPTYKTLHRFFDHGAACCENMIEAERKGYEIGAFPVDQYSVHLSGTSWQEIPCVWPDDHDVPLRPFVTFITANSSQVGTLQFHEDRDFNIVPVGGITDKMVSLHGREIPHVRVNNPFYQIRFQANGEYVCILPDSIMGLPSNFVTTVKLAVILAGAPKHLTVDGIQLFERKHWQQTETLSL